MSKQKTAEEIAEKLNEDNVTALAYHAGMDSDQRSEVQQQFLDSIWTEPVYSLLGADYTYKDVKDTELSLGLDLQGGMYVVLEVSPVEILSMSTLGL